MTVLLETELSARVLKIVAATQSLIRAASYQRRLDDVNVDVRI